MDEELATRPQAFPQVTELLVKSVSEELATRPQAFLLINTIHPIGESFIGCTVLYGIIIQEKIINPRIQQRKTKKVIFI